MRFDILTIFPELLRSPLEEGILRRALERQQISVNLVNIRDFAHDKHQMTDDRPFGGGEGMVMKPEPLSEALKSCQESEKKTRTILLSPQGRKFDQRTAEEFAAEEKHLIFVCGRYEGVDQRFIDSYVDEELSIGDFILTGGELGAMIVVDTVTRLLPDVLGCADSSGKDTFSRNLLKHPQYTRPREFEGVEVPPELLTGNHEEIDRYRFLESVRNTLNKRPQLLKEERFSPAETKLLKKAGLFSQIRSIQHREIQ